MEIERLNIEPTPNDQCGVCKRDLAPDDERLTMQGTTGAGGIAVELTVCRSCMSEHMPDFLAELERTGHYSIGE